MHRRRSQVLPDGQDVRALRNDVTHRCGDLVPRLTEPDHDPALADEIRCAFLRAAYLLERSLVAGLWANARVEARDRFDVVIQDLGPRREYCVERLRSAD